MENKQSVSSIKKEYPFLLSLLAQTRWKDRAMARITIKIDEPIDISAPFHDGCCRYTSAGTIKNGNLSVNSHYAGSYDTCLNNPVEVLGTGINGQIVKENSFYAIADSFEYWRSRSITIWVRSSDLKQIAPEKALLKDALEG